VWLLVLEDETRTGGDSGTREYHGGQTSAFIYPGIVLLQELEETRNAAAALVQHQIAIDTTTVVYILVTQATIENMTHCMVILPLYMSRYNQEYITRVHSALGSLKCISLGSLSPAYQPNKTKDTPPGGYHNLGGGRKTRLLVCRL